MADHKDDTPTLPPKVDRRALERAAVAYYSDPDRISTMPNEWIVTYGRTASGKILIQSFRKVFGAPKAVSEMMEVNREELQQVLLEQEEKNEDEDVR